MLRSATTAPRAVTAARTHVCPSCLERLQGSVGVGRVVSNHPVRESTRVEPEQLSTKHGPE